MARDRYVNRKRLYDLSYLALYYLYLLFTDGNFDYLLIKPTFRALLSLRVRRRRIDV